MNIRIEQLLKDLEKSIGPTSPAAERITLELLQELVKVMPTGPGPLKPPEHQSKMTDEERDRIVRATAAPSVPKKRSRRKF